MAQAKDVSIPDDPGLQDNDEILRRILRTVEKSERKRWIEIVCAVVLSLATLASAWCTYQSTLWRSVQTVGAAAANSAGRRSSAAVLKAQQNRAFDASMFIEYLRAKSEGNAKLENVLFHRFRPEMSAALGAWLKTDPFNNPAAPLTPFKMDAYAQPELKEAEKLDAEAAKIRGEMETANQNANNYVLLTVRFASVLFLGGIAGMMQTRRLRNIVLVIALVLFCLTAFSFTSMPVRWR